MWCGPEPLSVAYPTLYAIAASEDGLVIDSWSLDEGGRGVLERFVLKALQ